MFFYAFNVSADGYVMDAEGNFDWSVPDEQLHAFWNDVQRRTVLNVYGRRLWETMSYWADPLQDDNPVMLDFARAWQATPVIVVSRTLSEADLLAAATGRVDVRLVRSVSEVPDSEGLVQVGGPELASAMCDRIDEFWPVVHPTAVGGGTPFFPAGRRLDLTLIDQRRFDSGAVLLRCQRRRGSFQSSGSLTP